MALIPCRAKSQPLRFRRNIASSLHTEFHDENPLLLQFFVAAQNLARMKEPYAKIC